MTRYPGRDEHGRPIVAELGRAETPQEIADRRAKTSEIRRSGQNTAALVAALVLCLGIVALLVMVVVRPDAQSQLPDIDYVERTVQARDQTGLPLVAPPVPDGWYANQAQFSSSFDVQTWVIGLVVVRNGEDRALLTLSQTGDANPSWIAAQVADATAGPVLQIGGLDWTSYDRRDNPDPGLVAFALVTETQGVTIVISGTAEDADFNQLAESVATELTA